MKLVPLSRSQSTTVSQLLKRLCIKFLKIGQKMKIYVDDRKIRNSRPDTYST